MGATRLAAIGATVLVIEDNDLNRRVFVHALELAGYGVIAAQDGAEGLRLAEEARPDLVLLDMDLPQMPGLEVARRLRGSPATARLPILGVSALVSPGTTRRALELGCAACLDKPIGPTALAAAVARTLADAGATAGREG